MEKSMHFNAHAQYVIINQVNLHIYLSDCYFDIFNFLSTVITLLFCRKL